MNHHIKIHPEHYNNVKAGTKTFEIRKSDRPYQKGDMVTLREYSLQMKEMVKALKVISDALPVEALKEAGEMK